MKRNPQPDVAALKYATSPVTLLVATRKGAFILTSDRARRAWKIRGPLFLGHIVHHLMLDPRDRRTLLLAARTGHLGPTVFRSTDWGKRGKKPASRRRFPRRRKGRRDAWSITRSG